MSNGRGTLQPPDLPSQLRSQNPSETSIICTMIMYEQLGMCPNFVVHAFKLRLYPFLIHIPPARRQNLAKTIKHRPVNALILLYYPWRLSLGLSLQPSPGISRAHLVQKSMWALTDTDIAAIFSASLTIYSVLTIHYYTIIKQLESFG